MTLSNRVLWRNRHGYKTKLTFQDGEVYSERWQPDRDKILKRNRELQKNKGAVATWDFGRLALDIPHTDWPAICHFFPGIDDPNHPDHKWQMRKFLGSPASDPYRVEERKRRVPRGNSTI